MESNEQFTLTIMRDPLPNRVTRGNLNTTMVTIVDNDRESNVYV